METKNKYLSHLNYFRGIAIVFIVFGHCYGLRFFYFDENTTFTFQIIKNIVTGGTTFFVFISGYLLHYKYSRKFVYGKFLFTKIKYVLLPFFIFSSLDIVYYTLRFIISYIITLNEDIFYFEKIKSLNLIKIYLVGCTQIPIGMWYVPFIMVVFSLSKFYLKFIHLRYKTQFWIISLFMLLSTIIHRAPDYNISGILQNVLYFTPVYLLGIFISANYELNYKLIKGKEFYLIIIALFISILQVKTGKIESINKLKEISNKSLDLMIIQKSLLSIFFKFYLEKFETKKISLLNLLAANSFGIFFIHGIYIWLLNIVALKFQIRFTSNSIISIFISVTFVLLLSLFTTILIRKFIPKTSKYIIGC